jgi:hypothetical protein
MIKETIVRYAPPTKYDEAPFGTHCKVIHELSDTYDLYIQYSHDEEHPKWELMQTEIPKDQD